MPNPGKVHKALSAYRGSKIAVSFSGGFDSSLLSHALAGEYDCEVAMLCFDAGSENQFGPFFRPEFPEDVTSEFREIVLPAAKQVRRLGNTRKLHVLEIPTVPTAAITVAQHNLQPAETERVRTLESNALSRFYAGFVLNRQVTSLAVAAAMGYDYVITGHMEWNDSYKDESPEMMQEVESLFVRYYGSRLKKVPLLRAPLRDAKITKADLIAFNAGRPSPMPSGVTYSCNPGVPIEKAGLVVGYARKGEKILHCGRCKLCVDRKESFAKAGVIDEAEYAE